MFNGVATLHTVITPLDGTFNSNFGPSAPAPRVPITRLDFSGFWRKPL
jgi:hypothetical protein